MLVEVNLTSLSTRIIPTAGLIIGQPSICSDGSIIVFGTKKDVKRYGVKFCLNRLNGVYRITTGDEIVCITSRWSNARSPRVINDEVYFLSVEDGTPHFSASKLVKVGVDEDKIIVDVNWGGFPFPGLFLDILGTSVEWGGYLFCTSTVKTYNRIIRVELATGDVTVLDNGM